MTQEEARAILEKSDEVKPWTDENDKTWYYHIGSFYKELKDSFCFLVYPYNEKHSIVPIYAFKHYVLKKDGSVRFETHWLLKKELYEAAKYFEKPIYAEKLNKLSLFELIYKLPYLEREFAICCSTTHSIRHNWHRMRHDRILANAEVPKEVEEYVCSRLTKQGENDIKKLNIATVIIALWYVTNLQFKEKLGELLEQLSVTHFKNLTQKTLIIVENILYNKTQRKFDCFYSGDLAWLLGVLLNKSITDSVLYGYPCKREAVFYTREKDFPITVNFNNIQGKECFRKFYNSFDEDFLFDIPDVYDYDNIVYISECGLSHYNSGNDELNGYTAFEKKWKKGRNKNFPKLVFWELKPYIEQKKHYNHFKVLEGFNEWTMQKLSDYLYYEGKIRDLYYV